MIVMNGKVTSADDGEIVKVTVMRILSVMVSVG